MDPEYFAEEETTQRPALLPMFVATSDDTRYEETAKANADDASAMEHDWVTQRLMDSYN